MEGRGGGGAPAVATPQTDAAVAPSGFRRHGAARFASHSARPRFLLALSYRLLALL